MGGVGKVNWRSHYRRNRTKILAANKKWRLDNPKAWRRSNKRTRDAQIAVLRAVLIEAKLRPCADCGKSYPPHIMDLDHIKGVKLCNPSSLPKRVHSMVRMFEELNKCEAVCSNCHRERTERCRIGAICT